MEDLTGWQAGLNTYLLAVGCWLGAMLLSGLLTAYYRVDGLHRNGLLEVDRLGPALKDYLAESRRFQVTCGSLYLILTILGCFAWGQILAGMWKGVLDVQFYLLFTGTAVLAWTLVGLIFKMLAASTAVAYARVVGTLLYPLNWVLRPWSTLMLAVMDRLDDTIWTADVQPHLSTGEIRSLLHQEDQDLTLDQDEREMIQSIFDFHDTAVREIMIPRIDMAALDGDGEVADVIDQVIASGHSRIPVYQGGVDKVIGIIYSKDLLRLVDQDRFMGKGKKLTDLMRPAYFIPESKKIDEVLDEFREKRIHMAVVIDEYGGTAGLVTLEDVLEEIVGEIEDEFDIEEDLLTWIDASSLHLDPKINLEDLEELVGVTFAGAEGVATSETLGGLIYEAAGNVPQPGDQIMVAGFRITVEDVADQRILRVLLQSDEPLPGFGRRLRD